jgi:hypothetical protein
MSSKLQASAAMLMRYDLFWDITQRRVVIPYRRFGHIFKSQEYFLALEDGTDTLSRNVGKRLPLDAA